MVAQPGYESSYREHHRRRDPTTVLTFHASGDELLALSHAPLPFYKPPWSPTIIGLALRTSQTTPTGTRSPSW